MKIGIQSRLAILASLLALVLLNCFPDKVTGFPVRHGMTAIKKPAYAGFLIK